MSGTVALRKLSIGLTLCTFACAPQQPLAESPSASQAIKVSDGGITYPVTRKVDVSDVYHGTIVSDPYRWLEDDNSTETAEWVKAQNEVTFGYLDQIPFRAEIKDRLTEIWNYPKYSSLFKKGDRYYFFKNDGLQNQSVLYVQDDLESTAKVLIDPNTFSSDGTVALSGVYFSKEAKYMGYSKSSGGSDWRDFFVMDLSSGEDLSDHLKWIKFSGMAWAGEGFYYTRFPAPEEGGELSVSNENARVFFHRLGTDQSEDELVFADPENPKISSFVGTTEDERFLVLYRSKGTHGTAIWVKDLTDPAGGFLPVLTDYEGEHGIVDNIDDRLLMVTDRNASRNRLVLLDPAAPEEDNWKDIIPEGDHVLRSVILAGGKLIASYMHDVASRAYLFDLDGKKLRQIELPTVGSARGFRGQKDDKEVFFSFSSFAYPPTIFRYDVDSGAIEKFRQSEVKFNSEEYVTEQLFYLSKDSTRIPMFITHRRGVIRDGNNPTLLYGYGGFNISITPSFSTSRTILLEKGGVYAVANLRGGGEYGDAWHKAGMRLNKQNVFDDFIAAADYLVQHGYTSRDKLAVMGRSNGGLLIGAVINQRPDLCGVAFPGVGVMDMLRYHKFTIGWAWATDYGDSDDPEQFSNLYTYSPLHNIRVNGSYPATLITTADHDDRVVPAHSFKYAATIQEKNWKNQLPLLIRIETRAGHGAGKPTAKIIEEQADLWSFMFYNMGIEY